MLLLLLNSISTKLVYSKYGCQRYGTEVRNGSGKPPNQSYVYRSSNYHFWELVIPFSYCCRKGCVVWESHGMRMTETVSNTAATCIIWNYLFKTCLRDSTSELCFSLFPGMSKWTSQCFQFLWNYETFSSHSLCFKIKENTCIWKQY